jgi:Pyruvate/2-oxoacid:ferredoxin oxidoreductase gamma subunit
VDPALEAAMSDIDPEPKSRSRLIRNMAMRGAEAMAEDRRRHAEATETLLKIVRGEIELDLSAAREAWEERETMPCKQPPR